MNSAYIITSCADNNLLGSGVIIPKCNLIITSTLNLLQELSEQGTFEVGSLESMTPELPNAAENSHMRQETRDDDSSLVGAINTRRYE